jgi:hypothetical protein
MENRKIIGYKTPYDLFNGKVKKGDIATTWEVPFGGGILYNFKVEGDNMYSPPLPKEIVEQWEPVYEEEFKVGDWVIVKSYAQAKEGNGVRTENLITKLYDASRFDELDVTGMLKRESDFIVKDGSKYFAIRKSHIIRRVTLEEIKFKVGDWVTFEGNNNQDPYTTQIQGFDKDGWILSEINKPEGGHYKFIHYRRATPEEIEQVRTIEIGGVKAEFKDKHLVEFDGYKYSLSEARVVKELMERGQIKSLNVGCNGQYEVDLKLINKILDELKR